MPAPYFPVPYFKAAPPSGLKQRPLPALPSRCRSFASGLAQRDPDHRPSRRGAICAAAHASIRRHLLAKIKIIRAALPAAAAHSRFVRLEGQILAKLGVVIRGRGITT